jgi:hypothetical protein
VKNVNIALYARGFPADDQDRIIGVVQKFLSRPQIKLKTMTDLALSRSLSLARFPGYGVSLPTWLLILNELETTVKVAVARLS